MFLSNRVSPSLLSLEIYSLEVEELEFISIWKLPKSCDVFHAQIVPIVVIWIVWNFVVVDRLALSPSAYNFSELPGVSFPRS